MYYPQNQYPNQVNNVPNYTIPVTNNPVPGVNQTQLKYQTYTGQPTQTVVHQQLYTLQPTQKVQNVQQTQNYHNVQQTYHPNNLQNPQPVQKTQYVQSPGQPNPYSHHTQVMQPIQRQNVKPTQYNTKTNVGNDVHHTKAQQVILAENINQNPQQMKTVLKGSKPLSSSHNQAQKAPALPNVGVQQPMDIQNTQIKDTNFINNTVIQGPEHIENKNKAEPKMQTQAHEKGKKDTEKSATFMTVSSLARLEYKNYPVVEFSQKPFLNISGYGCNSYNGTRKSYNEDMIKVRYKLEKNFVDINNKSYKAYISYFAVFDGHGGDSCSKFLKEYLDEYLFNLQIFPINVVESIKEAFRSAEEQFRKKAIQNGVLIDKSGSCAVIALIINNVLYAINLGDSRALYSRDGGNELFQITRDHKPNDPKEKTRIEKAGGKVYYANETVINGVKVKLKEEQFGPGFKFPYRLHPSGLAVSSYF